MLASDEANEGDWEMDAKPQVVSNSDEIVVDVRNTTGRLQSIADGLANAARNRRPHLSASVPLHLVALLTLSVLRPPSSSWPSSPSSLSLQT